MSEVLHERMPALGPLWLAALRSRPGLRDGETLPRIAHRVAVFQVDGRWLESYGRVTGMALGEGLPATVPQAVALPLQMSVLTSPQFPLPLLGAVHVRQRIEVLGPLPRDARLSIACAVEGGRRVRRGVEVDLITEVEHEGHLCWRGVTTFLSQGPRSGAGGGASKARDDGGAHRDPAPRDDDGDRVAAFAAEPPPDPEISAIWRLPADLGRRFAAVAGDRNPIHLYPLTARPFGFKQPIIHGMWTLARALVALEAPTPPLGAVISCRFRKPLPLPGSARLLGWRVVGGQGFQVLDGKGRVAVEGGVAHSGAV